MSSDWMSISTEKKGGWRLLRQIFTVKKMEKKMPSRVMRIHMDLESQLELAR